MVKTGLFCGCWDLFHLGHLKAINFAMNFCDILYIGIFSDEIIQNYKKQKPIMSYFERYRFLANLPFPTNKIMLFGIDRREKADWVNKFDVIFVSEQLEKYIMIPDNYKGNIIKIPYTKEISTTIIIERLIRRIYGKWL